MEKSELASLLRKKIPSAQLPEKMNFELESGCLTITVHEAGLIENNMQENPAAFESWAIALKYHLADEIAQVVIDWKEPKEMDAKQKQVYNRFLYRITKFTESYQWAASTRQPETLPVSLVSNFPCKEASPHSAYKEGSEGWLECKYVEEHKRDFDAMARQLPVGLFIGKVSGNTYFTTGGALDIWAAKEDEISLFELKKEGNKRLGIISELMFYAHVVSDIMRHQINYKSTPELEKSKRYREFGKFYELYEKQSVRKIHAVFLANELHSMITTGLIDCINDSECFHKLGIRFSHETL
ncbi:MAG: hypothetical protein NC410_01120 [Oscillibacter sp.]|nr:hypothetical protein [Oscillibacter sp.]